MALNRRSIDKKTAVKLCLTVLFALGIRLVIAALFINTKVDLVSYNIPWALAAKDGVFKIYINAANLNYPPLFPFLLSFVSRGVEYGVVHNSWTIQMLFIKLIPCLFDTATVVLVFMIGLRRSERCALTLAFAWAVNVSSIVNCACWGQNDCMLMFFVLLMFFALEERRPVLAGVCFALGCLTKLQMAYFAVVLLLELIFKYPWKEWIKSLSAGLLTGAAGWLPFMIGAKSLTLPFDIYLGGFGTYNFVYYHAFNIYGVINSKADAIMLDSEPIAGSFTYNSLSALMTALIVAFITAAYITARRRKAEISPSLVGLVYICSIFMLTTRMHERYQLAVLPLCLLCFVFLGKKIYYALYWGFSGITLLNQCYLLFYVNRSFFSELLKSVKSFSFRGIAVICIGAAALAALIIAVTVAVKTKKISLRTLGIAGSVLAVCAAAGVVLLKAVGFNGLKKMMHVIVFVLSSANTLLFAALIALFICEYFLKCKKLKVE